LNKTPIVVEVVRLKTTTSYAPDISKCIPKNGTTKTISAYHTMSKFEQGIICKQDTSSSISTGNLCSNDTMTTCPRVDSDNSISLKYEIKNTSRDIK
jgi:hypothetical protein